MAVEPPELTQSVGFSLHPKTCLPFANSDVQRGVGS